LDEVGEALKLLRRELCSGVAQVGGDGFFEGAVEKSLKDALEGGLSGAEARAGGSIDKLASLLDVPHVPLFLEDAEESADGGLARRIGEVIDDLDGGSSAAGVDHIHDLAFAAAESIAGLISHGASLCEDCG
jgi:hypothetical protein